MLSQTKVGLPSVPAVANYFNILEIEKI